MDRNFGHPLIQSMVQSLRNRKTVVKQILFLIIHCEKCKVSIYTVTLKIKRDLGLNDLQVQPKIAISANCTSPNTKR